MLSPSSLFIGAVVALSVCGVPLLAEEKSDTPEMEIVVPVGQKVKEVHIPIYTVKGVLKMQFDASIATRTDKKFIDMENLRIQLYDDAGKPEMHVEMPVAKFDLKTSVIASPGEVTVKREDFTLVGETMEFDTKKRSGKLTGHVKMTIYNRDKTFEEKPSGE